MSNAYVVVYKPLDVKPAPSLLEFVKRCEVQIEWYLHSFQKKAESVANEVWMQFLKEINPGAYPIVRAEVANGTFRRSKKDRIVTAKHVTTHDGDDGASPNALDFQHLIGSVFAAIRLQREWTQAGVAGRLTTLLKTRVNQSYVGRVEANDIIVSMERFLAFCTVLKVTPEFVFSEVRKLAEMESEDSMTK